MKLRFVKYYLIFLFLFVGFLSAEEENSALVKVVRLDDEMINPITAEYIINGIDKAIEEKAECFVIEMDTPGGLLTSTRQIVKKMLNSEIPIIVYIAPSGSRAGSAGVFITLASNVAAMAPSTNIGAAHPVSIGSPYQPGEEEKDEYKSVKEIFKGKEEEKKSKEVKKESKEEKVKPDETKKEEQKPSLNDVMSEKIMNDTVAWIKSIAQYRGRNVEWAEMSVRKSVSITEEEALKNNVIEYIANNLPDLLGKINGKEVTLLNRKHTLKTKNAIIQIEELTHRQKILSIFANPTIAYALLILGFYGLLWEVTHPSLGVPGILGAVFVIIALYSLQMMPINYAGLSLIILAIILFVAEIKVVSHGLLALGGIVSMTIGSLMLLPSPKPFIGITVQAIAIVVITTALIIGFLIYLVMKTHSMKVTTGQEGLIGEIAYTETPLNPEGKVFVHGEWWDAICNESIEKGEKVKVVAVDGLKLKVERLK
jgi:membrane-bound serine protease (ClpP class)